MGSGNKGFNPAEAAVALIPSVVGKSGSGDAASDAAKKDAYTSQINAMNLANQRAQTQASISATNNVPQADASVTATPSEGQSVTTAELRKKFNQQGDASDSIRI